MEYRTNEDEQRLREKYKWEIEHNWRDYFQRTTAKPKYHIITGILFLILISITMVLYGSIGVMIVSLITNISQWFNAYLVVDEKLRIRIEIQIIKIKYYTKRFFGLVE